MAEHRALGSLLVVAAIVAMLSGACSSDGDTTDPAAPAQTEPGTGPSPTPTEPTDPEAGNPPTSAAMAADEAFRSVPDGYGDCGAFNLTSGWPTTAAYSPEADDCIVEAAASGAPSQYASYGRDDRGGIDGTILRVDGPGDIVMIEYQIDRDGGLTSSETTCSALDVASFEPPVCGA